MPDHQNDNLWNDKQFRQCCWTQANQSAIDSGTKAVNSLFLINGAAATALLAQPSLDLKCPAIIFAFAALVSIASLGMAFYHNSLLTKTFEKDTHDIGPQVNEALPYFKPPPPLTRLNPYQRFTASTIRVWMIHKSVINVNTKV